MPTISVGNLTAGGSGKTPVVLYLAGRWLAEGTPVGVLSRGYGRTEPGLRIVLPGSPLPGPDAIGDQPWFLRTRLPGLALGIDAARARGPAPRSPVAERPVPPRRRLPTSRAPARWTWWWWRPASRCSLRASCLRAGCASR